MYPNMQIVSAAASDLRL